MGVVCITFYHFNNVHRLVGQTSCVHLGMKSTQPQQKRAVAYYRVSTGKQGITGLGLDAQQSMVRAWALANGYELIREFIEVKTGSKGTYNTSSRRPELHKALQSSKLDKCALIVAKLDRIGRKSLFINELIEYKVNFIALDMPNPGGVMSSATKAMIRTLGAMAEYERDMASERTKAALKSLKERGLPLGVHTHINPDFNRQAIANKVAANVRWANIIPSVMMLQHDGLSIRAIATNLNLHATQVARIIKRNPVAL